jgi:hypothetical protein
MDVQTVKREGRWKRWLRLGVFLGALSCASTWWLVHAVSADFSERSLALGRQLDRLSEIARGSTTLELNGARLTLTSVTRDESVAVLLERFASLCARDSGGVSEQLDELAQHGASIPALLRPGAFGVFRTEQGEQEGSAACFARDGDGGLLETIRRIGVVLDSGDFGALGQLRYVFVRRTPDQRSHVLSISSLGVLPLARMFPERGDAPGGDIMDGVRPLGARRLVSARVDGSKLEAAMYESSAQPDAAIAAYDAPMRARGFALGDLRHVEESLAASTRVYMREDDTVLVLANARRDATAVSAFRLPSGGFVTVR